VNYKSGIKQYIGCYCIDIGDIHFENQPKVWLALRSSGPPETHYGYSEKMNISKYNVVFWYVVVYKDSSFGSTNVANSLEVWTLFPFRQSWAKMAKNIFWK